MKHVELRKPRVPPSCLLIDRDGERETGERRAQTALLRIASRRRLAVCVVVAMVVWRRDGDGDGSLLLSPAVRHAYSPAVFGEQLLFGD